MKVHHENTMVQEKRSKVIKSVPKRATVFPKRWGSSCRTKFGRRGKERVYFSAIQVPNKVLRMQKKKTGAHKQSAGRLPKCTTMGSG